MKAFKYTLRPGSKKDICPACHKKTFVPYIETDTGKEVDNAGRCDREQHCGYFKKPESNEAIYSPKYEETEVKTDYISLEVLDKHFSGENKNNFISFLLSKFESEKVKEAEYKYFLSDFNNTNSVVFWQIDQLERVRSGKIMEYNPNTGKRVKDESGKSAINWIHKKPFNLKQCLFGLHLCKECPDKPVGIVESEKTAVIMSIKEPRIIWMACGSLNGFKLEYLAPIRLRKIIGFPDKGCFDIWNETAQKLNEQGFSIIINPVLENNTNASKGDDIADHIL